MRPRVLSSTSLFWFLMALVAGVCVPISASAPELKIEAHLLWGTNDTKPPAGKDYRPVDAELRKKLKDLPLKWTNYFEVRRRTFSVPVGELKKENISDRCAIEVKNLDNNLLEVSLIGKGKEVWKGKQALPQGNVLLLGGNAPNSTGWFVVLKRSD